MPLGQHPRRPRRLPRGRDALPSVRRPGAHALRRSLPDLHGRAAGGDARRGAGDRCRVRAEDERHAERGGAQGVTRSVSLVTHGRHRYEGLGRRSTSTPCSGCPRKPPTKTSDAPTGSSRSSCTPMPVRPRSRPSGSRKRRRRTRSCATPKIRRDYDVVRSEARRQALLAEARPGQPRPMTRPDRCLPRRQTGAAGGRARAHGWR